MVIERNIIATTFMYTTGEVIHYNMLVGAIFVDAKQYSN